MINVELFTGLRRESMRPPNATDEEWEMMKVQLNTIDYMTRFAQACPTKAVMSGIMGVFVCFFFVHSFCLHIAHC